MRIQTGRPFLLTSGRQTLNQEDAGVDPQRHHRRGAAVDGERPTGTERQRVLSSTRTLIGADGRANPQFLAPPTTPGEQGQDVYLYGPGFWTADLGLAKNFRLGRQSRINFEALFINAFNHRNLLVGNTGGATLSASTRPRSGRRQPRRSTRARFSSDWGFISEGSTAQGSGLGALEARSSSSRGSKALPEP